MNVAILLSVAVLVSGCADRCDDIPVPEVTNGRFGLVSNGELATVWWLHEHYADGGRGPVDESSILVTTVDGAGNSTEPVNLGSLPGGIPQVPVRGTRSTLWFNRAETVSPPQDITLLRDDQSSAMTLRLTDTTIDSIVASYDGSTYHVFWVTADQVLHRTLGEDGGWGTAQVLFDRPGEGISVAEVAHGGGATILQLHLPQAVTHVPYLLDLPGETSRPVPNLPSDITLQASVLWFRGEFHLRGLRGAERFVLSFDPQTEGLRQRPIAGHVFSAYAVQASDTLMYALRPYATSRELMVIDSEFNIVRSFEDLSEQFVVLGGVPAYLGFEGGSGATQVTNLVSIDADRNEQWRTQLASTSPAVNTIEQCRPSPQL